MINRILKTSLFLALMTMASFSYGQRSVGTDKVLSSCIATDNTGTTLACIRNDGTGVYVDADGGGTKTAGEGYIDFSGDRNRILLDMDGDGNPDTAWAGDWDDDGDMDEEDIEAAIDALTDTKTILHLAPGTFILDQDADGQGEAYCNTYTSPRNPHVCLEPGMTLKGAGKNITILQLKDQGAEVNTMGHAPLIGIDIDGDTYVKSTVRVQDIHISDLTVETQGTCDEDSAPFAPGIQIWDCDDCSVQNIEVNNTAQAAVHFARVTNTFGDRIFATDVGNYDDDGAATGGANCDTGGSQPCLYLYTSAGVDTVDSGYTNSVCNQVGGRGLNFRSDPWVERVGPFGEASLNFDATVIYIAQQFKTDATDAQSVNSFTVWIRQLGGANLGGDDASGNITASLYSTTGATLHPNAAVDTFTAVDSTSIGFDWTPVRFINSGTPTVLSTSTEYAIVLSYTGTADTIGIQYDDGGTTDTYSDSATTDIHTSTTGAEAAWTVVANQDLNFSIDNGMLIRPFAHNISITDVSVDTGPCASIKNSIEGKVTDLSCTETGGVEFANAGLSRNMIVDGVTIKDLNDDDGFFAGEFFRDSFISNVVVNNTHNDQSCAFIRKWAKDINLTNISLERCGDTAVRMSGGNRNITFNNLNINGTYGKASYGIKFSNTATLDGISGGAEEIKFRGGEWKGVGGYAMRPDSNAAQIEGLTVDGITFMHTGKKNIDFYQTTAPGFSNSRITNNTFVGWGDVGNGSLANQIALELDDKFSNIIIIGNTFRSLGDSEEEGMRLDLGDADAFGVVATGNICDGTFGNKCIHDVNSFTGDESVIYNNLGSLNPTINFASGNTSAADCTGTCNAGICFDDDGDGTTNCAGGECFAAICKAGTWTYF